jgi:hypothetical protein
MCSWDKPDQKKKNFQQGLCNTRSQAKAKRQRKNKIHILRYPNLFYLTIPSGEGKRLLVFSLHTKKPRVLTLKINPLFEQIPFDEVCWSGFLTRLFPLRMRLDSAAFQLRLWCDDISLSLDWRTANFLLWPSAERTKSGRRETFPCFLIVKCSYPGRYKISQWIDHYKKDI